MLSTKDFDEKHIVLVFTKDGQRLSFKNDNLVVKNEDGKIALQVTCYRLFAVWVIGQVNITSGLMERSKKYCFSIVLFSFGFKPYGNWNSATEGNFLLRQLQYTHGDLAISKLFVHNKIRNQQALLKAIRNKSDNCKDAIKQLDNYAKQVWNCDQRESLLGTEGSASRAYFGVYFSPFDWKGRKPRAKRDITNVLMDIGYTQLFNFMEALLNLYGFDVYRGVYHQNFYQRKSLVCDLVEPFRVIVDHRIRKAYGLQQINEKDFTRYQGKYQLKYNKSKDYTKWLLEAILEHKEAMFLYVQQYYRAFMRQKPIEEYPVFRLEERKVTPLNPTES